MRPVDLHTHSTRSDGTCTPTKLVHIAQEKGLAAFALTDHDTTAGLEEAMHAAEGTDVEVIPGIEMSTKYTPETPEGSDQPAKSRDIHIVGLLFDYADPDFQSQIREFLDARTLRNQRMCAKMCADGIPIPYDELVADNPGSSITRANMAHFLLKKGVISSINEAFEKYIGDDCPYFIPREQITPAKAVRFLRKFHGIPILAHPFQYELGDEGLDRLVAQLKEEGLMGIEAYYCKHTPEMTEKIRALAAKYDLLLSGGSDFHGENKPGLEMGTGYGHLFVPEECLTKIKHARYHVTDSTKIFFCDFDGTLGTSEKNISPRTREAIDNFIQKGQTSPAVNTTYDKDSSSTDDRKYCKTNFPANVDASKESPNHPACMRNIFVLSSGRAMSDVKNLANRLDLHYPNMFLSAYNGAEVCSWPDAVTFYRETLPFNVVAQVFQLAKKHNLYCQTYDGDTIVVPEPAQELDYYTTYVKMPYRVDPAVAVTPEKVLQNGCPSKCLVIHLENPEDHRIEPFAKELNSLFGEPDSSSETANNQQNQDASSAESGTTDSSDHNDSSVSKRAVVLRTVMSNPYYLEVDPIRATKAYSLQWLCRHLGIDPKNSIAAGDAPNDNPMLRAAGIGIGMINGLSSNPDMKEAADIITTHDNDHDGLAEVLNTL